MNTTSPGPTGQHVAENAVITWIRSDDRLLARATGILNDEFLDMDSDDFPTWVESVLWSSAMPHCDCAGCQSVVDFRAATNRADFADVDWNVVTAAILKDQA